MTTYADWKRERDHWARLKAEVDRLAREIVEGRIADADELRGRTLEVEALCRELFPEKMDLFGMIYRSRFARLWEQFGDRAGIPSGISNHH